MRVLMAGSSGFLGGKLTARLRADGHTVVRLVRRPATGDDEVRWDPAAGSLDPAAVAGVDTVINLAGTPLGLRLGKVQLPVRPWTANYRRQFRAARVDTTTLLTQTIVAADPRPGVFLAGSATGWYGDTGDTVTDETAESRPDGFLTDTARVWEQAALPAQEAGVRVAWLRTGFPLDRDGGYLGPQLLPFRLGLGGRIGSGRHWQPWISMADWLDAAMFVLHRDDVRGPVNMVGPTPATNAELTRALGEALRRPTKLPLPPFALRVLLGEFGRDAVISKRLVPRVLLEAGFEFTHPDVRSAVQAAIHG